MNEYNVTNNPKFLLHFGDLQDKLTATVDISRPAK